MNKRKENLWCRLFGHNLKPLRRTMAAALIMGIANNALEGSDLELTGRACKRCGLMETRHIVPPDYTCRCECCSNLVYMNTTSLAGAAALDPQGTQISAIKKGENISLAYCPEHDHQVDPHALRECKEHDCTG